MMGGYMEALKKIFLALGSFLVIACALFTSSCGKKTSPESALTDYINDRFSSFQTREGISQRLTGVLLEKVRAMNDEEYKEFADFSRYKKEDVKIMSKNCETDKCFVTYVIKFSTFENQGDKKEAFFSESRKVAELHFVDDSWKLYDVHNVSVYHDALSPIEVPGKKH